MVWRGIGSAFRFGLLAISLAFVSGCGGDSQYKVMEDEADEFKKLYILLTRIKNADDAKAKKNEVEEIAKRLAELSVRGGEFPKLGLYENGPDKYAHYRSEALTVFAKRLKEEEIVSVLNAEFEIIRASFFRGRFEQLN